MLLYIEKTVQVLITFMNRNDFGKVPNILFKSYFLNYPILNLFE